MYENVHVTVAPGAITNGKVWVTFDAFLHTRPAGVAGKAGETTSVRFETVTGSEETDVFWIVTVKVTEPPGSWTDVGLAVFVTDSDGATSVNVTVAEPVAVAGEFSSSFAVAVTVLVCGAFTLPLTAPVNEQLYVSPEAIEPPAAQVPWPFRSPNLLSVKPVSVTGSVLTDEFVTTTVYVTDPPGSGNDDTEGVFVTLIVGATLSTVTLAEPVFDVSLASSSFACAVTVFVCDDPALPDTFWLNEHVNVAP